ncbi:MAG: DnaJ domain-containing protein, partial [Flavobacteriaceae bacterium]
MKDYYNILNISRNAKDSDIKNAYRRLAMTWHPD